MPQAANMIVQTPDQVRDMLDFVHAKPDCCLVIDGGSLQVSSPLTQHLTSSYAWTSSAPSL